MSLTEQIKKIYPTDDVGGVRAARGDDFRQMMDAAKACDEVLASGRKREGTIFLSKFNPFFTPPDFLHHRTKQRASAAAAAWDNADQHASNAQAMFEHAGELATNPDDATLLEYKSRSPFGIPELQDNITKWLSEQGISYPQSGAESSHSFVCANSVNSTLLPRLFQIRKTGGLFTEKQNEVASFTPVYGLLPFNAYDANLTVTQYKTSKEDHYKPTAEKVRNLLKNRKSPDKLRAIAFVNPANPTGACFSKEEIDAIAEVVCEHNDERAKRGIPPVLIIVDETFRNLMWKGDDAQEFYPFAKNEKLRPYTISLNTFSKDIGPGVGFAFAYGPPELIKEMPAFDGPAHEAQLYAAEVFNPKNQKHLRKHRDKSVALYKERYESIKKYLDTELNPALKSKFGSDKDYVTIVNEPNAGFHIALDFSALRGAVVHDNGTDVPMQTSAHLAVALMEKANVVAYPGEMFYLDGKDMILRASLNLDRYMQVDGKYDWKKDALLEAMKRIKDFCMELEPPARWQALTVPSHTPSQGIS